VAHTHTHTHTHTRREYRHSIAPVGNAHDGQSTTAVTAARHPSDDVSIASTFLMRRLQLRFHCDSTATRLQFDHSTTFVTTVGTAAWINKLCGRPPQYAPAPCKLTFDLLTLKVVPSHV